MNFYKCIIIFSFFIFNTLCSENDQEYPTIENRNIKKDNIFFYKNYAMKRIVMIRIRNCIQTFILKHQIKIDWDELYANLIRENKYDCFKIQLNTLSEIKWSFIVFKSNLKQQIVRIIMKLFQFWSNYARLIYFLECLRNEKWCEVNIKHINENPFNKFLNKYIYFLEGHKYTKFNIYKYENKVIAIHKESEISSNFRWGKNVIILKNCIIGENTVISDETLVGENCNIGSHVRILKNNIFYKNISVASFVRIHHSNVFMEFIKIGIVDSEFCLKKSLATDILYIKIKYSSPDQNFYNELGKILYENCSRIIIFKGNIFCDDITIYNQCVIANANYFGNKVVVNEFSVILIKNIFFGENKISNYINIQYKNVFSNGSIIDKNIINNYSPTGSKREYCILPYKILPSVKNNLDIYEYNNSIFLKELKIYFNVDFEHLNLDHVKKLYPSYYIICLKNPNSDLKTFYWRKID